MQLSVGIDTVEIARFAQFHTYSRHQLSRLFSAHEIEYCLQIPQLSAQRFAARFALKEAFLKALCQHFALTTFPLLTVAKAVSLDKTESLPPQLLINWSLLQQMSKTIYPCQSAFSLTHSTTIAIASITLYQ